MNTVCELCFLLHHKRHFFRVGLLQILVILHQFYVAKLIYALSKACVRFRKVFSPHPTSSVCTFFSPLRRDTRKAHLNHTPPPAWRINWHASAKWLTPRDKNLIQAQISAARLGMDSGESWAILESEFFFSIPAVEGFGFLQSWPQNFFIHIIWHLHHQKCEVFFTVMKS